MLISIHALSYIPEPNHIVVTHGITSYSETCFKGHLSNKTTCLLKSPIFIAKMTLISYK